MDGWAVRVAKNTVSMWITHRGGVWPVIHSYVCVCVLMIMSITFMQEKDDGYYCHHGK